MKDSLFKNELRNIKRNSKIKDVKNNPQDLERLNRHPFYGKQERLMGVDVSKNRIQEGDKFPFNSYQGKSMGRLNRATVEQLADNYTVNQLKFQNDVTNGGKRAKYRYPPLPPKM